MARETMNHGGPKLVDPPEFLDAVEFELRLPAHLIPSVSLVLIDLDGMKQVEASFGYRAATDLLVRVGHALGGAAAGEVATRLGGDQFAFFIPARSSRGAVWRAGRLLGRVRRLKVRSDDRAGRRVRASVGGASAPPDEASVRGLIYAAHQALCEAKRQGGDRLVWSLGQRDPLERYA
jgi:diguanylate cyclase (GGDEF)-like protein